MISKFFLFTSLLLFSLNLFAGQKEWTLMFYLSGDNNLTEFIQTTIKRMDRAYLNENNNILVMYDGDKLNDSKIYLMTQKGKIILDKNVEYNMGSVETIAYLVKYGIENYPAKKYALAFNGHGRGILNGPTDEKVFSPDENSNQFIREAEFATHLSFVLDHVNNGNKLDLLVMGSCLMGNLEAMTYFSKVAKYAVASEYVIYIKKRDYLTDNIGISISFESLIETINRNPQSSSINIGKTLIREFKSSYKNFKYFDIPGVEKFHEATLAFYDLSEINMTNYLMNNVLISVLSSANVQQILHDLYLKLLSTPKTSEYGLIDAGLFFNALSTIISNDYLDQLLNKLYNDQLILDKTILHIDSLSSRELAGISIYMPNLLMWYSNPAQYQLLNEYLMLQVSIINGLSSFIREYLNVITYNELEILTPKVNSFLNNDGPFPIVIDKDSYTNEYYLYQIMEIVMKLAITKKQFARINKYIKMILYSNRSSIPLTKHRNDLKKLIYKAYKKERNFMNKEKFLEIYMLF